MIAAALVSVTATSSFALERSVERAQVGENDPWRGGTAACTVTYYNACVGWVWTWRGWSPGDVIGVQFDPCCAPGASASLSYLDMLISVDTPIPPGYGFTGSIDVWNADGNNCPTGSSLFSTSYLPVHGLTTIDFTSTGSVDVTGPFVVTFTAGTAGADAVKFRTDFDATGPTGPQGCGACFPTTRVSHSYYYGTAATPVCPGSKLSVICEVEWEWSVGMDCATSVEDSSWGAIKSLYH
jgi:hypothetical protein